MRVIPSDLKVGDEVSMGFNGDWYPDGKVARITKSGKYLYTDTGTKYVKMRYQTRAILGGEWEDVYREGYQRVNSCFVLAKGVFNERNPHF